MNGTLQRIVPTSVQKSAQNIAPRFRQNKRSEKLYVSGQVGWTGMLVRFTTVLGKQGSKIRSSYIKFAQQERIKMADKIKSLEQDIQAKEGEVEAARGQ